MKYAVGQTVRLKLLGHDRVMQLTESGIEHKDERSDVGTAIILERKEPLVDITTFLPVYKVAVIDGRFDPHRNDLGELWVNEFEIVDKDD